MISEFDRPIPSAALKKETLMGSKIIMKKHNLCTFFTNFRNYYTPRLSLPYSFLAFQGPLDIDGFYTMMSSISGQDRHLSPKL
jgi:hypothetical protein